MAISFESADIFFLDFLSLAVAPFYIVMIRPLGPNLNYLFSFLALSYYDQRLFSL